MSFTKLCYHDSVNVVTFVIEGAIQKQILIMFEFYIFQKFNFLQSKFTVQGQGGYFVN